MLISTLNCEMWPNFSYRGVRSEQLLLLLLLLIVFSSENFGFSPPYAGIAGIGPASPAPNESLPYWLQGNFTASFVLKFCLRLREFLLSAFANRFELRCEPKRLMLLYYKICPCCDNLLQKICLLLIPCSM